MNNVVKHSAATEASVTVWRNDGRIALTVRDNGKGFVPETTQPILAPPASDWSASPNVRHCWVGTPRSSRSQDVARRSISRSIYDTRQMSTKVRILLVDDHPVLRKGRFR